MPFSTNLVYVLANHKLPVRSVIILKGAPPSKIAVKLNIWLLN